MILIPSFHLRLLSSLDFDEPFDDDNPDDTVNGNDDFGGDDFAIVDKCVAEGGIDASFSVGEIDTDVLNEDKLDDDERNSKTDVCSCSGNNDNFINCLEDNDDNSGDGVASNNGDVVDKGGVAGADDIVDNDGSDDEFDDKPFDHDDNDRLLLARAYGSQRVGIVVDDDTVDDGCADP